MLAAGGEDAYKMKQDAASKEGVKKKDIAKAKRDNVAATAPQMTVGGGSQKPYEPFGNVSLSALIHTVWSGELYSNSYSV